MDEQCMNAYIRVLEYELVPALGCTEPGAVAFTAASAAKLLGREPERLRLSCSGSVIKNVHSVFIPNAGALKGVEAAAILGALIADPARELCILEGVTPAMIEKAQRLCKTDYCACALAKDVAELYIRVVATAGAETADVTVSGGHTNIVSATRNGQAVQTDASQSEQDAPDKFFMSVRGILEFADACDIERIAPLLQKQIDYNAAIAKEGLAHDHGVNEGRALLAFYGGDDVRVRARANAAAGSDARMDGCTMPVVINSGSGNQGITVSLPVAEYARTLGKSREETLRALALANLIAILQKRTVGNLSAFCGAVHAAGGAACGIAYLMGGGYETISDVITYTLGTIGGMLCDGAKASCASKISHALDTALMGLQLSMQTHACFSGGDGLVRRNVENTIESFGQVARLGMKPTNEEVLAVMLQKDE